MGKIVMYNYHGVDVFVDEDLKGKHRDMCLCFRCAAFIPGEVTNCAIAEDTFKNCVKNNLTTPVFECPIFEEIDDESI
ncbi:hypothetical protein M0R19_05185 [Candidatus Pacearchaeota archaeon]|jgi:hypothetical protein|nr:hypothetical protein [Candidatus Pacearchaeota archaeon]